MKNVINNHFFSDNSTVSVSAALLIHAVLLSALFIKFITLEQERQKEQIQKQKMAQPIAAPVLLYATPAINPAPTKKIATPQKVTSPSIPSFSKKELQEAAQQAKEEMNDKSLHSTKNDILKKDTLAKQIKKEIVKQKPIQETKKQATNLISIPKEPTQKEKEAFKKISEAKTETDSDEVRKRKLTLADLFKTMPHAMEEVQKHATEGGSDQLVIAQGDIRYYSFLKKFITHMNQVFAFRDGPNILQKWAGEGLIKKNVGISIVIDKKGNVLEIIFLSSSGYTPFDELTKKTVQEASPFPPAPEQFKEKTFRVELTSAL